MITSFYALSKQLVSVEGIISDHLRLHAPLYGERDEKYLELARHRMYLLTEMARTLGYDLVEMDANYWRRLARRTP
jgi:hypothetical protein